MNEKDIIKALKNKTLNPFYYNDSLYEAIYCSIVQHNDYIRELKSELKCWRKEKPTSEGNQYGGSLWLADKINEIKNDIKATRQKRKQLQKASELLLGDDFSEYDE